MAKKRRKEEEEEFKLPEFDEEAFLRKEITGAKVLLIVVFLALLAAALSYFLTVAGVVIVAFFAGFSLIFLLRYLLSFFKVDTKGFERKDWLGQATTYFFTWLAFWILIMNVPFTDVTQPSLTVYVEGRQVVPGQDITVKSNYTVVTARATDNAGIMDVTISINGADPVPMDIQPDGILWSYNVTGISAGSPKGVTVTTADINGNPPVSVYVVIAYES